MTMKILSPTERQNTMIGRRAGKTNAAPPTQFALTNRDESAEAKPLDYVELPQLPVTNGFGVPVVPPSNVGIKGWVPKRGDSILERLAKQDAALPRAKPAPDLSRYTGSDLAREANIKRQMDARDHEKRMEKIRQASDAHDGYFYPTSLSTFVQDHRIMRKGPWK